MEVILRVEEGHEQGREFRFTEADNFLVGRNDVTCKAHWKLSQSDTAMSRHHFLVEVRPPNCVIRDNGSKNGTWVRRGGQGDWERITEAVIADGDQIKAGHTILSVRVAPPPAARPKATPAAKGGDLVFQCIRCGEPLAALPVLEESNLRDVSFMCPKCRREVESARAQEAAARAQERRRCQQCGSDVTALSDRDGRAIELAEACFYFCEKCAKAARAERQKDIGGYMLLKELGRGGMGVVYKAWHVQTGRVVALKQMLPMKADERAKLRFLREMAIMQDLVHPNMVRLIEAGHAGQTPFFVSEFVTGGDLNQFMGKDGSPKLPPAEVGRLIAGALVGLQYFHERGFVHRDIKPENILLQVRDGTRIPKLADFGLARSYEKHGGTITRTGEYAGTLMYIAEEQIISFKHCAPPVDIYAMGVALYYLLTGYYPLEFPPMWQIEQGRGGFIMRKDPVRMILEDKPKPVGDRRKDLPGPLCQVVDRATRKQAPQRFGTAGEFRSALLAAVGG